MRATAKAPADRFADAAAMLAGLEWVLREPDAQPSHLLPFPEATTPMASRHSGGQSLGWGPMTMGGGVPPSVPLLPVGSGAASAAQLRARREGWPTWMIAVTVAAFLLPVVAGVVLLGGRGRSPGSSDGDGKTTARPKPSERDRDEGESTDRDRDEGERPERPTDGETRPSPPLPKPKPSPPLSPAQRQLASLEGQIQTARERSDRARLAALDEQLARMSADSAWSAHGERLAKLREQTVLPWAVRWARFQVGEPVLEPVLFGRDGELLLVPHSHGVDALRVFDGKPVRFARSTQPGRHTLAAWDHERMIIGVPNGQLFTRIYRDAFQVVRPGEDVPKELLRLPAQQLLKMATTSGTKGSRLAVSARRDSRQADPVVWLVDLNKPSQPVELRDHPLPVAHLTFSRDGRLLYTVDEKEELRVCDAETGAVLSRQAGRVVNPITALELSPDGRWLLLAAQGGRAKMWNAQDAAGQPRRGELPFVGEWQAHAPARNRVASPCTLTLGWSPDSRRVVSFSNTDGRLKLWDLSAMIGSFDDGQHKLSPEEHAVKQIGEALQLLAPQPTGVSGMRLSDCGQSLALHNGDGGEVSLWSVDLWPDRPRANPMVGRKVRLAWSEDFESHTADRWPNEWLRRNYAANPSTRVQAGDSAESPGTDGQQCLVVSGAVDHAYSGLVARRIPVSFRVPCWLRFRVAHGNEPLAVGVHPFRASVALTAPNIDGPKQRLLISSMGGGFQIGDPSHNNLRRTLRAGIWQTHLYRFYEHNGRVVCDTWLDDRPVGAVQPVTAFPAFPPADLWLWMEVGTDAVRFDDIALWEDDER